VSNPHDGPQDGSQDRPHAAPHIRWTKGGEARVATIANDAIALRSTVPAPPGARIEGRVEGEPPAMVRVKVHGSKRQADGGFVIEGRLLDATREVRTRLLAMAAE
jgi:hypothetical protein